MNIDEAYIRMMNEEIDGVISDEDAEKLASYVSSDPEAGRYYNELQTTVRAIDDTADVEPPPELRRSYLRFGIRPITAGDRKTDIWRAHILAVVRSGLRDRRRGWIHTVRRDTTTA